MAVGGAPQVTRSADSQPNHGLEIGRLLSSFVIGSYSLSETSSARVQAVGGSAGMAACQLTFPNTRPPQCLNGPGRPRVLSSAELLTGSGVGAGSDTDRTVGGMGAHCSPVAPAACRRPYVLSEREHPGLPPTYQAAMRVLLGTD